MRMLVLMFLLLLQAHTSWADLPHEEGKVQLSVDPASQSARIYTGIEADQGFAGEKERVRYVITAANLTDHPIQIDWQWAEQTEATRAMVSLGGGRGMLDPQESQHYYLFISPMQGPFPAKTTMVALGEGRSCILGTVEVYTDTQTVYYPRNVLRSISGCVRDRTTGCPLQTTVHAYAPTKYRVYTETDGEGRFTLMLPPGEHILQVPASGYYTAYRTIGEEGSFSFVVELDPIEDQVGSGSATLAFPQGEPLPGWLMGADVSPNWDTFALVFEVEEEGNSTGKLYCIDGSGDILWTYSTPDPLRAVAFSDDGREIAAVGRDLYLFSSSGDLIWKVESIQTSIGPEYIYGRVVRVVQDRVFVGCESRNAVRCFSLAEGTLLWEVENQGAGWIRSMDISRTLGRIVAGTQNGKVVAMDFNGHVLWEYWAENNAFAVSIAESTGEVGAASWDGCLHFLDSEGDLLWRYRTNTTLRSVRVAPDGKWVLFTGRGIYGMSREGKLIWHSEQEISNNWSATSADGLYALFPGGAGTPAFLFTADGTRLLVPHADVESVWFVLMKENASLLAIPDKTGRFYVFEGIRERGGRPLRYTLYPQSGGKITNSEPATVSFNRPVFPVGNPWDIFAVTASGDTIRPALRNGVLFHPWHIEIIPQQTSPLTLYIPEGLVEDIEGRPNPPISWSFSGFPVGCVEETPTEVIPRVFHLSRNFPNPFNEATTFFYSVPEASRIVLEVYDIKGQFVERLVDGPRKPGTNRVIWRPEGLASGLYLCVLRSGGDMQVRKLVLVK